MDAISAYLPMDRRFALARREQLPDRCSGAALFADISGFTPLTAAYAAELGTQRGAEEIIRQLNLVYDALVDILHLYGGSVIGFSGDALTCWIDGDNGRKATACALEMQQAMEQFREVVTPGGKVVPLALKVVVTAGSARRFLIGMPTIQRIEVLAGNTLSRLGAAEGLAEKGEVIVGAEVMAWFGDKLDIKEWRQVKSGEHFAVVAGVSDTVAPNPWPPAPDIPTKKSKDWLLPPVYERLERGEGAYLAQLRPSVALFLRFTNIDYDLDPEAGLKLDTYVRWVQRVLNDYQGYLLQLTIGEKGSYVYAAFGAPLAYENNAARAVAAAMDLQQPPRGLRFCENVEIGITQGMVRMGSYGGEARQTYGAQGNQVNIAARLMAKARPGQIIVSPEIMEETNHQYIFDPLGPVSLKGLSQAMPLYAVNGRRRIRESGTLLSMAKQPLVGRHAELLQLQACLTKLCTEKTSSTVIIEGEAGIGKSRLVAKLLEHAYNVHVETWLGAGNVIEQTTAYHAWRPVFREILNIANVEDTETVWQQTTSVLEDNPQLLDRIPLLNDILPFNLAENELTHSLTGDVRAANTRNLLVNILAHATRQSPKLLVLEDAHWLDSASWALVEQVMREVPGLLLVVVTRPLTHNGQNPYSRLRDYPDVLFMQLDMLTQADTERLIGLRLGVTVVPPQITELIHSRAEGHPFFSEELALALRDSNVVVVENGRCQLPQNGNTLNEINFPDTIQQVITSRIDRLSPAEQLTLKVASVIGRVFALNTLAAVHPVVDDKPYLPQQLDTLTALDITHVELPEPPIYTFKHSITQEVAYNLLLFAQRRDLHQAVAEWYETMYADELPTFFPLLAHHWLKAEVPEKAAHYLGQAGEQSLRSGTYREAIAFFLQLLDLYERYDVPHEPLQRAHWERLLAEAYWGIGNLDACRKHASQVLKLLEEPEPESKYGSMLRFMGQFAIQILHLIRPSSFFGRLEHNQKRDELSRSMGLLSQVYYLNNDFWRCYHVGCKFINLEEQIGVNIPELARAYAQTSLGMEAIQMNRLAQRYYRQSIELTTKLETPSEKVTNYLLFGMKNSAVGKWSEAEAHLQEALYLCEEIGDWRRLADSWQILGYSGYLQGDFIYAGQMGRLEYEIAQRQGNFQQQTWGLNLQALQQLRMGETREAVANWQQAIDLLVYGMDNVTQWIVWSGLAQGYLQQRDYKSAYEVAWKIYSSLGRQLPITVYLFDVYTAVSQVYLTLWQENIQFDEETPNWPALAQQAVRRLGVYARTFPIGKPRALLYYGQCQWLLGDKKKAFTSWRNSIADALDMKMRYDEALAHAALGHHLDTGNSARKVHFSTAEEIFTQLLAQNDLARLSIDNE